MAATQQSAGVNGANLLYNAVQQLRLLRSAVNEFVTQYNDNSWGTVWAAFATAAVNADGSLGQADASPNAAHPIDTRIISGLQSDRSVNDMTSAVTALEAFQSFLTGAAVATANRNAVFDLFEQG